MIANLSVFRLVPIIGARSVTELSLSIRLGAASNRHSSRGTFGRIWERHPDGRGVTSSDETSAMGKGGAQRRGPNGRMVGGGEVSIFEMWASRKGDKSTKTVLVALLCIYVIDVGITVILAGLVEGQKNLISPGIPWTSFRHDAEDLVWLAIVRALALPGLSMGAFRLWWRIAQPPVKPTRMSPDDDETSTPLRSIDGAAAGSSWFRSRNQSTPDGYGRLDGEPSRTPPMKKSNEPGLSTQSNKMRADLVRDVALALVFLFASICQGYIGVKVCEFDYEPAKKTALFATLMGSTTILVNVEAWLLSNLVYLRTQLVTTSLPHIHKYPLVLSVPTNNWCDLCDKRIVNEDFLYRDNVHNFDVCLVCYAREIQKAKRNPKIEVAADSPLLQQGGNDEENPSRAMASAASSSSLTSSSSTQSLASQSSRSEEKYDSDDSPRRGSGRGGRGGRGGGRRGGGGVPLPPSSKLRAETDIGSWEIIRRVAVLMAPDWPFVAVAVACVIGASSAALALPSFQGRIIDAIYGEQRGKFNNRLELYLVFSLGAATTSALKSLCFQVTGRKLTCTLRNTLYECIIKQDISFFDTTASGSLTSRLTQDVNQMTQPLTTLVGTLTSALIQLFGGIFMAFYTSWRLSMLAFTTVGPIMQITQAYASWSREQNRKILAHLGSANACATEALANIRTVKAMATDPEEVKKYSSFTTAARDRGVVDAGLSASTQLVNNLLDYGAGWLILFYGGMQAMSSGSGLSAGRLVTYQLYFTQIQSSYNSLISLLSNFTRASGAAQRVFSLLSSLPNIDVTAGTIFQNPPRGDIDFDDVNFAYESRPEKLVLKGLTLHVAAGSTVALVGRSGSGKSTTLNLVLRFYDPQQGRVKLDGIDLRDLNARDFRKYCGVVAQETQLFDTTIMENIKYGASGMLDIDDTDVYAASKAALAHDFISEFPNGYETRIGERGVRISGGQKQRMSIARAFLRAPRILLLDEATSALDAESEAKVQVSLDNLIAGGVEQRRTTFLVAHRLSTVRNADVIAVLDHGVIVELGNHDSLLQHPDGIYATLVKRQLETSANELDQS